MISDDKRREIAARLRITKSECESRDYPWMVEDLLQALGFERYEDAENGIFDRRADLIDVPTTVLDLTETTRTVHGEEVRVWECRECGQSCEEMYGEYEYCPHCRRKVVRAND